MFSDENSERYLKLPKSISNPQMDIQIENLDNHEKLLWKPTFCIYLLSTSHLIDLVLHFARNFLQLDKIENSLCPT